MTPADASNANDQQLADLLDEITQGQLHGQPPDWERLGRDHPALVGELKQLVNLAQLAESFARADPATPYHDRTPAPTSTALSETLPRTFCDYELLQELGRGAMGVVYKAWEPSLQRFVAVKMLLRGEHATVTDVTRFRGEAQSAALLSHRNIVPVYKVGQCEGRAYFTMKYVQGQTLARKIAGQALPGREAARLLSAISRAVQHAHQNGILHRDLKPSNVLIDTEGQPLVSDFGLAKRVEGGASLTGTGAIVGTPSYMAPEQAAGGRGGPSPASDVYSLGAILYEMLTGRPPFQAATPIDVLLLVRSEEAVRPRLLNSQIDPDLELICLKCLEKRPEHRYASAAQLADDLDAFLQSEPVSARISNLAYFLSRILRETHHAPVLENWGLLWMWHSLTIFLLCAVTNVMYWLKVQQHGPYMALWGIGLMTWGAFFWNWRRQGGPVTFVERQMAHAWAAGVVASVGAFIVEVLLELPVLKLSPILAVCAGMVFLFKAGTLSGWFYVAAVVTFLMAVPMALFPEVGPLLFGAVSAVSFFVPGLKYYRQRLRAPRLGR